jgi:hypothetical protein
LDLCSGVAIFPQAGSFFPGINQSSVLKTLINSHHRILLWKFDIYFYYDLELGLCGPGWAAWLDMDGKTEANSDKVSLTIHEDQTSAGFFVGLVITLGMKIIVWQLTPHFSCHHWHPHIYSDWSTRLDFDLKIELDIIKLLMDLIKKALAEGGGDVKDKGNVLGMRSYSMYAAKNDTFRTGDGSFRIEPLLNLPIDVLPEIPYVGDVIKACDDIGAKLKAGPVITFGIPVDMHLNAVKINDQTLGSLWVDNGSITGRRGTDTSTPTKLGVEFKWTPSIDFRLGWFISFSLFSLFHIGAQFTFSVTSLLGIDTSTGTHYHTLSNTIGGTLSGLDTGGEPGQTKLAKVIFHDPGENAA